MLHKNRVIIFWLLLFLISFYLYIFKLPFPSTDEMIFKEPARNFALNHTFASPGVFGYRPGVENCSVWYPPVYAFIYGVWFMIFGFSISSSLALSLLICLFVAYAQYKLFKIFADDEPPVYILGLIFFSWILAIKGISRPDTLAVFFGLALVYFAIKYKEINSFRNSIFILLSSFLCLATSFWLGLLIIFFAASIFLGYCRNSIKSFIKLIASILIGLFLTLFAWLAASGFDYKLILSQALSYALFFISDDFVRAVSYSVITHVRYADTLFYLPLSVFLFYIAVRSLTSRKNKHKDTVNLPIFLGLIISILILIFVFTLRHMYTQAFLIFFISTVVFLTNKEIATKKEFIRVILLFIFIGCLPFIRMNILLPATWTKADTYDYNRRILRNSIPSGSSVMVAPELWYMLAGDYTTYDLTFSLHPYRIDIYDYLVFSGNGSGSPSEPMVGVMSLYTYYKSHLKYNYNVSKSTFIGIQNNIFGVPISKSRWSYRFELRKRIGK